MKLLLLVIVFVSAVILVTSVLMHSPKGEGLGAIGAQARVFNTAKDMESGLTKFTGAVAAAFLISSLLLALYF